MDSASSVITSLFIYKLKKKKRQRERERERATNNFIKLHTVLRHFKTVYSPTE
jgi:hypothetical protein